MADEQNQTSWGTWEELLLACAVKRHGFKNWDSVSMELRTKSSLPRLLTTAQICQQKYHDLQRRFSANHHHATDVADQVPWLDELRRLRLAELRRDLHRYDLSILTLQSKVKRLEEERERSLSANPDAEDSPDLAHGLDLDSKHEEPEKDKIKSETPPDVQETVRVPEKSTSGEEENRSVNGSNSTGSNRRAEEKTQPDPVGAGSGEVGPGSEELGEPSLSSDVQSSASLERKRKSKGLRGRRKEACRSDGIKEVSAKSEPLLGILQLIRAHSQSSLFERRLQSQESWEYKSIVRQHLDLDVIQRRLNQEWYSSNVTFYRDLLLLFNNAIVFFPKQSPESLTAHDLRNLLLRQFKTSDSASHEPPKPLPLQIPSDSLLDRQKSSAPIIVCRKRSSASAKPADSSFALKGGVDPETTDGKTQAANSDLNPSVEHVFPSARSDKPTTGTRTSIRRSVNSNKNSTASASKNDKQETPKKKAQVSASSDKKRSVVDFLKRIKKNSPASGKLRENMKSSASSGKTKYKGKDKIMSRKSRETRQAKEDSSPSKRSVGRPPKKEAGASGGSGKRGRERERAGGAKEGKQQQRKRAKR